MILPTKHISAEESLIGVGALILERLIRPKTVSALWEESREIPCVGSFDRFALALSMLYALGAIDLRSGRLQRVQK